MPRKSGTRKPLKPGDTTKAMEASAKVRAQIGEEEARHRAKMTDYSHQRREAAVADLAAASLAARLARIMASEAAEQERHRLAMERLRRKFR